MNALDVKTLFLAKHAQHVVLIHFPIALFIAGVGFDLAAYRTKRQALACVAYYNIAIAAVSTLPAILTGVLAWRLAFEGQTLKGILLFHVALALTSTALICVVAWLHWHAQKHPENALRVYRISLELFATGLLTATGYLGGFLSGVNGRS